MQILGMNNTITSKISIIPIRIIASRFNLKSSNTSFMYLNPKIFNVAASRNAIARIAFRIALGIAHDSFMFFNWKNPEHYSAHKFETSKWIKNTSDANYVLSGFT